MRCEVCGGSVRGEGFRRVIEGVRMVVCYRCSNLGAPDWESVKPREIKRKPPRLRRTVFRRPKILLDDLELIDGYGEVIRRSRLKLGLSHKELGRKIGEKVSTLKKIEKEKITPDRNLTAKLEHALRVKLLVKAGEERVSVATPQRRDLTLGDIVQVKGKKEES